MYSYTQICEVTMKKTFCLLLVLLMVLTVLCACDQPGDGKIKITIGFWPEASQTSDIAMYNEWKAKFEEDYPEYEIVAEPYTYSPETVAAKGNIGALPTVFQTYFTEPEMLIREQYIRPVTEQLEELGWLDKMDDSMRATLSKDGEVYGIPRDGYGMGLFINLELMYDIGLIEKDGDGNYKIYDDDGKPLYPTTLQEVTELCRLVRDTYIDVYGILILSANKTGGWQLCNLAWNFGAGDLQIQDDSGAWSSNLTDQGMVDALKWIQELASEDLCYPGASLNYNDFPAKIGMGQVLMAFVGNDALSQPITGYNFDKDNFAFVPMPTGDGTSRHALFGGTPYVFAENATDEQVEGALKFLHYIGRSPVIDDISRAAMEKGFTVAQQKGMPILPTIKAWKNQDYLDVANEMETRYINVNYAYMEDFFNTIHTMRRAEEPNFCQEMYSLLDNAIQNVLANPNANPLSLLTTANTTFQNTYLSKINK